MTTHWKIDPDQAADLAFSPRLIDLLIPGNSHKMQALKRLTEVVAPLDAPVLVMGETGVGKELVAQAIHRLSGRKGELIAINCAAIPAELLEGELFGHEKGAFTGADRGRAGLIEQARGGTLFLDEIGDMPLAMQAKLLRVLETRKIRHVGGHGMIDVDFRLVAATHRGLADMAAKGTFRQDLFYRLAVFPLMVPSLAERPGDIPLILDRLLADICPPGRGLPPPRFGMPALRAMAARHWPGNVRELRAIVQRAAALFPGQEISAQIMEHNLLTFTPSGAEADLPQARLPDPDTAAAERPETVLARRGMLDLRIHIRDIEIAAIETALRQAGGCVSRAADMLRLRRTTLIEKMKKYSIVAQC